MTLLTVTGTQLASPLSGISLTMVLAVAAFLFFGTSVYACILYFSQRRKLTEAETAVINKSGFSRLLETVPVPVSLIENTRGRIMYANKAWLDFFEFANEEEALKLTGHDLVFGLDNDTSPNDETGGLPKDYYTAFHNIIEAPGTSANEITFKSAKGKPLETMLFSTYFDYNGVPCTIGVHIDISAHKKAQKTAYLALKREKDENRFISALLNRLSEELAAPANSIASLSEAQTPKNASKETLKLFKKINEEARHITQILNDNQNLTNAELIDFTQHDEEFELDALLATVLAVIARHFDEDSNVALLLNTSLNLPRFIIGDKRRLWLILKSFLDNCAKYVTHGKIVISVNTDQERTDDTRVYINFMIKDNCAEKERISSITSDSMTYGIGAAKKLITLLGGDSATEHDKTGVLFKFSLPFKRSANDETTMQAIDTPVLFGLHILLVDDDELSLKIMTRLLNCSNARPVFAKSGAEAAAKIKERRQKGGDFDIILLDHNAPFADDVFNTPQLPSVIMLADINKRIKNNLRIADVIEKPFVPTQFIRRVCAVAGQAGASGALRSYPKYRDTTVLVCDDNIINQETTANMLAAFNIECVMAENGREAVEILESGQHVDLVFMDLYMPVMDGFDATRAIRGELSLTELPIISLSSDAMPQVIEKCIQSGMNGHLPKPIEFRALNDLLQKRIPAEKRV